MNSLDFAKQLSESSDDAILDYWAETLSRNVAKQTAHLVEYWERVPESLRDEYIVVLMDSLSRLPNRSRLNVSVDLFESLKELVPEGWETIKDRFNVSHLATE